MKKPQLTRYLYEKRDIQHSLIYSILKKTDFNECLFWTSEYYYSGYIFDLWKLIWKIYYDFYAINHPKLEKFIIKMLKKWIDKQKIVYILHIIKNFYYNATKNPIVFQIRMGIKTQTTPTKSYRGRPPSWLNKTTEEKKYKNLLLSIHNKHYKNIAYHLRRYKSKEDTIIPIILKYLKKEKKFIIVIMKIKCIL